MGDVQPVHYIWQSASDIFSEDDPPYLGDVLFLDFLGDESVWIKVKKSEEREIRAYLESCHLRTE